MVALEPLQGVGGLTATKAVYIVNSFIPSPALRACFFACGQRIHFAPDQRLHLRVLPAEGEQIVAWPYFTSLSLSAMVGPTMVMPNFSAVIANSAGFFSGESSSFSATKNPSKPPGVIRLQAFTGG
jgi:hypothetical protein